MTIPQPLSRPTMPIQPITQPEKPEPDYLCIFDWLIARRFDAEGLKEFYVFYITVLPDKAENKVGVL